MPVITTFKGPQKYCSPIARTPRCTRSGFSRFDFFEIFQKFEFSKIFQNFSEFWFFEIFEFFQDFSMWYFLKTLHPPLLLHLQNFQITLQLFTEFLRLTFQSNNSWTPHINLKAKCINSLSIIKYVSHPRTECNRSLLLQLYNSLIRAQLSFFEFSEGTIPACMLCNEKVSSVFVKSDGVCLRDLSLIHISEPTRPY